MDSVRSALGLDEGYLLPRLRRIHGCQMTNSFYASLLPCPYREALWQCEVVGSHTKHRWSSHLIKHERAGNGWACSAVGD